MINNKTYWNLKSRLTRATNAAKKKNDPMILINEVEHARKVFEEEGFPDAWARWPNGALAEYQFNGHWGDALEPAFIKAIIITARNEADQWH